MRSLPRTVGIDTKHMEMHTCSVISVMQAPMHLHKLCFIAPRAAATIATRHIAWKPSPLVRQPRTVLTAAWAEPIIPFCLYTSSHQPQCQSPRARAIDNIQIGETKKRRPGDFATPPVSISASLVGHLDSARTYGGGRTWMTASSSVDESQIKAGS